MDREKLKNSVNFSDVLEKYNYDYALALTDLEHKYYSRPNKQNKDTVYSFIRTYISNFSLHNYYTIANSEFDNELKDFILREILAPAHNISQQIQSTVYILFQQAHDTAIIQINYRADMKDIIQELKNTRVGLVELNNELNDLRKTFRKY